MYTTITNTTAETAESPVPLKNEGSAAPAEVKNSSPPIDKNGDQNGDYVMSNIRPNQLAGKTLAEFKDILEMRYGGGFAQWIMDRLPESAKE